MTTTSGARQWRLCLPLCLSSKQHALVCFSIAHHFSNLSTHLWLLRVVSNGQGAYKLHGHTPSLQVHYHSLRQGCGLVASHCYLHPVSQPCDDLPLAVLMGPGMSLVVFTLHLLPGQMGVDLGG